MLSEQTENKPFANAIAEVRDSVQRGETLAVAMAEHPKIFPNLMVQMVAAGESSGGLDKAFSRVGSQFEKEAHLKGLIHQVGDLSGHPDSCYYRGCSHYDD